MLNILRKYISDQNVIWLIERVIRSFSSTATGKGLPLGNLTSQLLVNIYMNEFDQFVKHKLKAKYYVRYADDFVILSKNKNLLEEQIVSIGGFLRTNLRLELHPDKVFIKPFASGVDFLGWVHFSDHRILRTTTKRRMLKRIAMNSAPAIINSYLGLLGHGNTYKLQAKVSRQHLLNHLTYDAGNP